MSRDRSGFAPKRSGVSIDGGYKTSYSCLLGFRHNRTACGPIGWNSLVFTLLSNRFCKCPISLNTECRGFFFFESARQGAGC